MRSHGLTGRVGARSQPLASIPDRAPVNTVRAQENASKRTSSPRSSKESVLSVLTKFRGASKTRTIFSSAPLTNCSRSVNATDASGYPWICGRPSSAGLASAKWGATGRVLGTDHASSLASTAPSMVASRFHAAS